MGGALVGLGVILEAPKIFSIPVAAVFVGIVLEAACTLLLFGFDEGISASSNLRFDPNKSKLKHSKPILNHCWWGYSHEPFPTN